MSMIKYFTWEFEDGVQYHAPYADGAFVTAREFEPCPARRRGHHNFKAVMDLTQWGFDRFKWIAVKECRYCHETWAVTGEIPNEPMAETTE